MSFNSISYLGISGSLPTNIEYFKEELFNNIINIPKDRKPIYKITSASVDCKVNSMKLLNTNVQTSNEGQKLSGKKLLVELNLSYRIKYISDSKEKYLYMLKSNVPKVMYIVLPKTINDIPIEEFFRKKKIVLEPYIEDIYSESRGANKVYIRTLLLLNTIIKS
jgi:hypothetical protein